MIGLNIRDKSSIALSLRNGSRQRCPESRAAQRGALPAARTRAPARGCLAPRPGLFHLQAPGLSLSRTGSATQVSRPGRRCEGVPSPSNYRAVWWTDRLRDYAASTKLTLSEIASRALSAVLHRGEVLADRPSGWERTLRLEYQFDRLLPEKLAQAYELLVAARIRPATGQPSGDQQLLNDATGRSLRPCVLGSPEREPHDLQPTGGTGRACRQPWIEAPTTVIIMRQRIAYGL